MRLSPVCCAVQRELPEGGLAEAQDCVQVHQVGRVRRVARGPLGMLMRIYDGSSVFGLERKLEVPQILSSHAPSSMESFCRDGLRGFTSTQ